MKLFKSIDLPGTVREFLIFSYSHLAKNFRAVSGLRPGPTVKLVGSWTTKLYCN